MKIPEGAKVLQAGQGQVLQVAGGHYTVKASGGDTGGAYALIEMLLPPQSGPVPHRHAREEESFYILEGTVLFQVGEASLNAGPGAFVKAPRGVPHAFKNVGEAPARMLMMVTPAGLEKFFAEIAKPEKEIPEAPGQAEDVRAKAAEYGITILGEK